MTKKPPLPRLDPARVARWVTIDAPEQEARFQGVDFSTGEHIDALIRAFDEEEAAKAAKQPPAPPKSGG